MHARRRDLGLHLKAVGEMPFVRFRPELSFAARLDEVHGDARAIAVTANVALDDEVGAKRVADVTNPRGGTLNERGRRPRDDPEAACAEPAELRDHLLAQSFGEVFL